jgi:hypothetical protein
VIRLVRAELIKLVSTRLWIGLLIAALAISILGAVATFAVGGTPEGQAAGVGDVRSVSDMADLVYAGAAASLFALVAGAAMSTGEHRHGTIAGTFLITPARWRVVVAKVLAALVVGFGFGVASAVVPLVVAIVVFLARGETMPLGAEVPVAIGKVGVQCAYAAAFGAGIGAAMRSQLWAILSLLAWLFLVESILWGFFPSTLKWLPFAGVQASWGTSSSLLLPTAAGGALMLIYVLAATGVGIASERARDV